MPPGRVGSDIGLIFDPTRFSPGWAGFLKKSRSSYLRQDTNLIQKIVKNIIRKSDHEGLI